MENLIACHADTGMRALDSEKSEQNFPTSLTQTLDEQLNDNYSTLCLDEARHFINKHPDKTLKEIALIENLMEIFQDE
tara:strand:- start:1692 stop:1925 length:234 start_codon:yes stop_codon:yes gene_type:complete